MKKSAIYILFALTMAMPICASAQVSEIVEFPSPSNYKAYKTIVRNFNEYFDVIAVYGNDSVAFYEDTIGPRTTFFLRKLSDGTITELFTLNGGYCVNDFRFVTLKKLQYNAIEDFCCFCGTRMRLEGYWTVAHENEPSQYIVDSVTNGFVGIFSMDDARWQNSGSSAKVADIYKTKELFRLTCYTEKYGEHWHDQNTFQDNAVLDVIGSLDASATGGAQSCLARVKIYPDYPSAINNTLCLYDIRHRDTNDLQEIMLDVTGTDDYTVTVSQFDRDNNRLILRYSTKENVLYPNNLELSSTVYYLYSSSISPHQSTDVFELPIRLCPIESGNQFALAFSIISAFSGVYTFQFDATSPGLNCLRGVCNAGKIHLKDLTYLPLMHRTLVLARHEQFNIENIFCGSTYISPNYIYSYTLYDNTRKYYSVDGHFNGNNDRFTFGGIHSIPTHPAEIGSQTINFPFDEKNSCLEKIDIASQWNEVNCDISTVDFPIHLRNVNQPVSVRPMTFAEARKKNYCEKKSAEQ